MLTKVFAHTRWHVQNCSDPWEDQHFASSPGVWLRNPRVSREWLMTPLGADNLTLLEIATSWCCVHLFDQLNRFSYSFHTSVPRTSTSFERGTLWNQEVRTGQMHIGILPCPILKLPTVWSFGGIPIGNALHTSCIMDCYLACPWQSPASIATLDFASLWDAVFALLWSVCTLMMHIWQIGHPVKVLANHALRLLIAY